MGPQPEIQRTVLVGEAMCSHGEHSEVLPLQTLLTLPTLTSSLLLQVRGGQQIGSGQLGQDGRRKRIGGGT